LAEAILKLKELDIARVQMGKKSRAFLEKNYTRNHCIDKYERMLATLYNQNNLQVEHI